MALSPSASRTLRVLLRLLLAVVIVAVLLGVVAFGALMVFTNSEWGHERVRRLALSQLQKRVAGKVRIGSITGNLLREATLHDVSITDSAGAPFLAVEQLTTHIGFTSLFAKQLHLYGVRLYRPVIVLDKPPGGQWNYRALFPGDSTPKAKSTKPGFGSDIQLTDVRVIGGRLTVRSPWHPHEYDPPAEQAQDIEEALGGEKRLWVVRHPLGFQKLSDFRNIDGFFPLLRLAHPQFRTRLIEVAQLSMTAQPFRPPVAEVLDLQGKFELNGDSAWWSGARARLPGTFIPAASGRYNWQNDDFRLRLRAGPAAFRDFQWVYTRFPSNGTGSLDFALDWVDTPKGQTETYQGTNADVRVGGARLVGDLGLAFDTDDDWRFFDTKMRFTNVETRLIEATLPFLEFPRHGNISGDGSVEGTQEALRLGDFDFTWRDRQYGVNHAWADGTVGWTLDERKKLDAILAKDLHLRLYGVQPQLLHGFNPEVPIPIAGTATGRLVLSMNTNRFYTATDADVTHVEDGLRSRWVGDADFRVTEHGDITHFDLRGRLAPGAVLTAKRLILGDTAYLPIGGYVSGPLVAVGTPDAFRINGDLVHEEDGVRSHLTGGGAVALAGNGRWDVNVRAHPLALATVGKFAPSLQLRGSISGPIRAVGSLKDLRVATDLAVSDGGHIALKGRVGLNGTATSYDLDATANVFNASAISGRAPATSITATAYASGRGIDPATMRGTYALDVTGASRVSDLRVDYAQLRASVADGLARVDTLAVRSMGVDAQAGGTFGLTAARTGTLTYRVAIDSLNRLHGVLAGDVAEGQHPTGTVPPRPLTAAHARQRAIADSARVTDSLSVVRMATSGRPRSGMAKAPAAVQRVDVAAAPADPGIPNDSVAGAFAAAGVLKGNLASFDLRGRAAAEHLVLRGNAVGGLRAEYALTDFRTPQATAVVGVQASGVSVAGFAFDSADVRGTYAHGTGDVAATITREGDEYGAVARYTLDTKHSEVEFSRLALRLDSTVWRGTRPGAVSWGEAGIGLRDIELRNQHEGRIYANGLLPTEGNANLYVEVDNLQVADVTGLLQSDPGVRGVVTGRVEFEGTTRSPRFRGAFGMLDGSYGGTALPTLRATLDYANRSLAGRAEALAAATSGGAPLAVAEGRLPIDLGMGVTGSRIPENGPITLDVNADSLPLTVVNGFTDLVSGVKGTAAGTVRVRGTLKRPNVAGALALTNAEATVVPTGVHYSQINGQVRLAGDTVIVDSVTARSRGTILLRGGIGIAQLARPSFELYLTANNARVLGGDRGEIFADAQIALAGPFEAPRVSGGATIRSGVYYLPPADAKSPISASDPSVFNVIDTTVAAEAALIPTESDFMRNLRVDVALRVNRDVWVRRSDVNVEVYTPPETGDLQVRMDRRTNTLGLVGVVSTDRGTYEFLSKRFAITRGSATFVGTEELNPTVQATGEYEVQLPGREAINIQVVIGGTLERPRISLQSDAQPPIPQSDLLSYLVFDRSTSSLLQIEGSGLSGPSGGAPQLVGDAAALAARRLASIALGVAADEVEGEATRTLELDVFNITPADVPTEINSTGIGSFFRGTRVELGKYTDPNTFVGLAIRPATIGPGLTLQRRWTNGFRLELSSEPRFVLREPTLTPQNPITARNWAAFIIKEWRY